MAITAVSVQAGASTATPTFAFGFTASAGDLLVIAAGEDSVATVTWPGSWVEIKDENFTGGSAHVAYLIASGGETSVVPTSTLSERWEGIIWRIPAGEWHGTTAPEINTGVTGSSVSPNPGSITPSWGSATGNIFLALAFRDDSVANTITAYPTNYTTAQLDNNATTSACNVGGAVRIVTGSPEDPGAFTISASETWIAYAIAVRPAAAGTTVTPTTASLTITTFAPTVTATDHKVVTPTTASLTLTTFAPSVNIGVNAVPTTASLILTTFAPTVSATVNQTITPTTASLTISTFAPTVTASNHKTVTPTTASLTLTTFAPTVTAGASIVATPGVASLTLSTFAPTVTATDHKTVTPATATLTLTTFAPTVTAGTIPIVVGTATGSVTQTMVATASFSLVHSATATVALTHTATASVS